MTRLATNHRFFRWLGAPLLLLVGLLGPQAASGAPPAFLRIDPNPVVFAIGAKSATVHLTWSTGDDAIAAPQLCHNYGGLDVSCVPLQGASGATDLTIPTSSQAYDLKLKRTPDQSPDVDVLATTTLKWTVDNPTAVSHPGNFAPPSLALPAAATLTTLKQDVVEDEAWYCSIPVPGKGLNLEGTGNIPDQVPSGVQIGYSHYFDPGVDPLPCSDKIDDFERGGVRFDMAQALTFMNDHGIKGATLSFRMKDSRADHTDANAGISCLDHIEVSNQLWWAWQPNSHDTIPAGPISIPVPHGNLRGTQTDDARMNADGSFTVDVLPIIRMQLGFGSPTLTGSWVLVGADESFPQNNDVCLSSYGDFALTLIGER